MSSASDAVVRLALFASGRGSNAEALLRHFQHHPFIHISALFTNNPQAAVIEIAQTYQVPVVVFTKEEWQNGKVLKQLQTLHINYILLAGFLWLVPQDIIQLYRNRILNIHPSLLPKYGGKGMYGKHVHEAVLQAVEKESGITIHLIDEAYDRGKILFQKSIEVLQNDTAETLAKRINQLELTYYGPVAEEYINGNVVE